MGHPPNCANVLKPGVEQLLPLRYRTLRRMEVESEWVSKKRERASPNQAKKRLEWATRPRFGVVGFNPIDQAEFPAPSGYPAALYGARCNEYANGMTVPDSIETSTLTQ